MAWEFMFEHWHSPLTGFTIARMATTRRAKVRSTTLAPGVAAPPTRLATLADSGIVRRARAHPDLTAALCFAGLVVVYLFPVLIGTKILSPNGLLYAFTPWTASHPPDILHWFNPLLSDVPTANYPARLYARDALHHGTLPQWYPDEFGGMPLLSNPQLGVYTPFNLPIWLLPLNYGLGLSAALKLWTGAFGMYLLVRQLRLGWLPGLLAGTSFAFCAYNITWLTHETLPAVVVMLPWMVWLIERLCERARTSTVLWLAVVTAIAIGGGHPGTQVHVLALAGVYALIRVWLIEDLEQKTRLKLLGLALGGVALGTLIMAIMLIPEALSSHGTVGTAARAHGRGTLPGTIMPFDAIKTTLFPDWWGRPSSVYTAAGDNSAGAIVNYNERTFYAGVVSALFGLIALVAPGSWRKKAPFAALAFLGLAIPLHLPGLWQLVTHVPPFDVIQNQRIHFAYAFGISVLAAFGLRDLLDRPEGQRRNLVVPALAIGLGLVVLLSISAKGSDISHTARHFVAGTIYESVAAIELTSTVWFLLFAFGVGAALLLTFRRPRWRYGIAVAVVLLAAADGLHFAKGYQPMGPAAEVIPPRTGAIDYLVRHVGDSRINGVGYALGPGWGAVDGLADVRGYAPPNPTKRMLSLWRIANVEQLDWTPLTMNGQEPDDVQVESVLGARYVIAIPGATLDAGARLNPQTAGLRVVYSGKDAVVVENSHAAPHVQLPARIELAGNQDDAEARLAEPSFYPKSDIVIESSDPAARALAHGPVARGRVRIARQDNARTTLDATLDRTGLVVLNDSLTDGWSVKVDGRPARPVRVNSVMRGVVAGPGRHTIVWSYSTPGLKPGAVISVLALLGLLGGAVVLGVRSRRRRPDDGGNGVEG
jgi:Bacterial membrane protein YfhO